MGEQPLTHDTRSIKETSVNNASTRRFGIALVAASALLLTACSSSSDTAASAAPTAAETAASACAPDSLATLTTGKLVIATGEPAYYPWVIDDAPESGAGFEAAVAYAVATQLGYAAEDVSWVRTTFDGAITPGAKEFDFNLQQFSITEERKAAVDFSSPYYSAPQAIVSYAGSPIEGKTTIEELKGAKLGAGVGTTSLDAISTVFGSEPQAFNDNAAAVAALKNGQIDGIVVDLPTAFYLSGVEVDGGIIVGQLPSTGDGDNFGLLLTKDSPITFCVSQAVDAIRTSGELDEITAKWLSTEAGAPVLK
ncbi:MAG: transporter substrate-binding domain-containing protein [Actinobacteria bacterium]|nr:transporter substrate-binding domain-containing protein [Actinomycetota bacterium]MSW24300.1 transporter substrate-binding domain-containing protein [Actinomycetota bacterium]MSX29166.1 transporter substrate-binding domain-containing protein [Actinomycetota bacterium]MSX42612.1 transporter substrate-binding domain-containing protein [Actinomycetota bacterium]MSX97334.1 transporter substrate-binding domain-containing protein [Actinomycetota bacterium]